MRLSTEMIERLLTPQLETERVKLCGVKVSGQPFNPLIQVFIDCEEGHISIKDCTILTQSVKDCLELEDSTPPNYRLEVSSPGIDWPLSELWQFRKNIGRMICLPVPRDVSDCVGSSGQDQDEKSCCVSEMRIIAITENDMIRLELPGDPVDSDHRDGMDYIERTVEDLTGARVVVELFNKKSMKKPKRK